MKIQRKFLIIILSLLIFVGISSILISRYIATNIIKQQITNNLINTTQSKTEHIITFLDLEKEAVKQLSVGIVIEELLLSKKEEVNYLQKFNKVTQRLNYTVQADNYTYDAFILDAKGTIVTSSDKEEIGKKCTEPYFLRKEKGISIKDVYISSHNQRKTIAFSAPIFSVKDTEFLGAIVFRVSPEVLFRITTDRTGLGKTGEVYLVNSDGYMITPSRFIDDVILKQKIDLKHIEGINPTDPSTVLIKKVADIVKDYREIEVLRVHTHIPEMGWSLVAKINTKEAFAPVTQMTNTLLLLFALILLISILVSSIISRAVTRPLSKLHEGTEEITKGNLNYKVGTSSPDEVGQLSRAFDEMTANLKKSRENLEKKVEERTQDLEIDIEKRKQTEKNLRAEKEFTDTLIDTAQTIILVLDKEGKIISFNHFMEEISGYQLEEVKGKSWFTFLPERDREKTQKLFLKAVDNIQTKGNITPIVTKDGQEVEIEWYDKTLKDENGKIIGLLAIGLDITERKRLQKTLEESEERLSFALDATNDGVWDANLKTGETYHSNSYYKMLGYKPGEITITNKAFEDMLHSEDKENVLRKIQECVEGKIKEYRVEFRIKTKSGKWKWILGRGNVVSCDSNGKALRFLGTHEDISERKQMEEALRNSKEKFANLFRNNLEAIVYTDKDSNILDINPRFTELFGHTLDEIKGKNIDSGLIQTPDKIKESKELSEKALIGTRFGYETIRKKKDGTLLQIYITGYPLIIDGKTIGRIGVYQDITERKKMEKELEKLARIDSLTGCYSRGYGLELLDRQVKLSKRNKTPMLLAFLDIDGFKLINDNFGHDEGDKVLKESVKLFKSTLRETDIICRMGGDEFLLIFLGSSSKETSSIRGSLEKNLSQLNKRIKKDYQIKFSMGFSEYLPDKPKALNELINIADQRMYKEKKKNKEK